MYLHSVYVSVDGWSRSDVLCFILGSRGTFVRTARPPACTENPRVISSERLATAGGCWATTLGTRPYIIPGITWFVRSNMVSREEQPSPTSSGRGQTAKWRLSPNSGYDVTARRFKRKYRPVCGRISSVRIPR